MYDATTKDIWVFGDLRNQRLFGFSLNVLAKARELSRSVGGKAAVVFFRPSENESEEISTTSSRIPVNIAEKEFVAHGADHVYVIENRDFIVPGCETYARSLADLVRERLPMLVLFALSDFGREMAAMTARTCNAGLIADCMDLRSEENGITGVCPAWGG